MDGSFIYDEWAPHTKVSTRYMSDAEVRRYVRDYNKQERARGNYTRLRSVEVDDGS